ncbi:hypothetical protein, partial [Alicyclobacillus acidiphilus]|uniref:hypothetical protein n=1 Tax=Alicyclobacillus acidiphilus TaxID=182455 RepID=UPI001C3F449C
ILQYFPNQKMKLQSGLYDCPAKGVSPQRVGGGQWAPKTGQGPNAYISLGEPETSVLVGEPD